MLDALLAAALPQLADVQVEDRSARTYHYKNEYLLWQYSFLKEWHVDAETARVTVNLIYGEPVEPGAAAEAELCWRAELFQRGQESRIDERSGSRYSLADIERQGMADAIAAAIQEGTNCLPTAPAA
jgi:hypothetical protein